MSHNDSLKKAVDIVGLKNLALSIGVSYQAIQKYLITKTSAENVIAISMATDWQVTPHELRPDIYPHPNDGLPENMRCACEEKAA